MTDVERQRMVHDLRGALAILSGQCEIFEARLHGPLNAEQARSVDAMRRQVERLKALVEQVAAL